MNEYKIITRNEVCKLLQVSRTYLDHAGKNGNPAGPPFFRVGKRSIRYVLADVMAWLADSEKRLAV